MGDRPPLPFLAQRASLPLARRADLHLGGGSPHTREPARELVEPFPGTELGALDYAVVDVETTGGSPARGHRITEVAVVAIRGGAISLSFQTLVNPGRPIPPAIQALTGITDAVVAGAPPFEALAGELLDRLEGRVFVAQNARFDWSFVSAQMGQALGWVPGVPRLCTVRMARRLVPGLPRRNLDALASHFGIPSRDRHRASGDAFITARVFLRLLEEAGARGIHDLPALRDLLEPRRRSRGRAGADQHEEQP